MGEIIPVIQAILNGVKSPIKAGVGALLALFLYLFVLIQKGNFRDKKAEADKKFAELEAKDIIESGSGVCKPTNTTRWSFGQAVECRKRIIERRLWVNRNDPKPSS